MGDWAISLQPLLQFLKRLASVIQRVLDPNDYRQGDAAGMDPPGEPGTADGAAPEGASDESRNDAMRVLEQVCTGASTPGATAARPETMMREAMRDALLPRIVG